MFETLTEKQTSVTRLVYKYLHGDSSFKCSEKNCLSLSVTAVLPPKRPKPLAQRHSVTPQKNWHF